MMPLNSLNPLLRRYLKRSSLNVVRQLLMQLMMSFEPIWADGVVEFRRRLSVQVPTDPWLHLVGQKLSWKFNLIVEKITYKNLTGKISFS